MAHNLYNNTMAFTGEIPWHGLGVQFEQEFTATEAIEAAGLGFEVTKEPIYRMLADEPVAIPGRFLTINNDNQEMLGMVGDRYEILQNRDAFCFFDEIMAETGARFITAGALGNGERVWMLARLPETFEPLFGDKITQNCLLTTGHDGYTSTEVRFTPIRVVCQNTLTAATRGSKEIISIRHTESIKGRLQQSAIILKEMNAHFAALGETFSELASFRIDDEWLTEYERLLFGEEPKDAKTQASRNIWMRKVEGFQTRMTSGMGVDLPGVSGTAWAAYNAAVEWADYAIPVRDEIKRTESLLWGRGNQFKQTAFDSALALVRR